jgi:hypothetical protein
MHIGLVLGYSEELKMGCLLLLDSNLGDAEIRDRLCQFSISDLGTIIYEMKIVVVEKLQIIESGKRFNFSRIDNDKKCKYQGFYIHDNYPKFNKSDFINFDKLNLYDKEFLLDRLPYTNESLFNFFIESDFYIKGNTNHYLGSTKIGERPGDKMDIIKRLRSLLDKVETFSIDKAIESFDVCVQTYTYSRPGKDDSASIAIVSKRDYWTYSDLGLSDPYVEELFSGLGRTVASDRAYTSCHTLLRGLWEELGGENNAIKKLNEECAELKTKKINAILNAYSLQSHKTRIRETLLKHQRDIRGSMEIYRRKIKYYFTEDEKVHEFVNKK